jgi:hypothetical protein
MPASWGQDAPKGVTTIDREWHSLKHLGPSTHFTRFRRRQSPFLDETDILVIKSQICLSMPKSSFQCTDLYFNGDAFFLIPHPRVTKYPPLPRRPAHKDIGLGQAAPGSTSMEIPSKKNNVVFQETNEILETSRPKRGESGKWIFQHLNLNFQAKQSEVLQSRTINHFSPRP